MTIEEMIKNSQCFGIAFDKHVPECKTCDVKLKCESKCRMIGTIDATRPSMTMAASVSDIVSVPSDDDDDVVVVVKPKPQADKPKTKSKPEVKKPGPQTPNKSTVYVREYTEGGIPQFKLMTLDQLEKMAEDRGLNLADFEKYKSPNIRRMRITMALKKTYK